MQWYYAHNNEQHGPVTEEEFQALVSRGVITPDTLVWNETLADWQPYAALSAPAYAGSAAQDAAAHTPGWTVRCVQCGNQFHESETIPYENVHVCAACKPFFFQSLREGNLVPGQLAYAGFAIRAAAKILDMLIVGVPLFIISFVLFLNIMPMIGGTPDGFTAFQIFGQFGGMLFQLAFNGFFIGRFAATPGKMICGIKVVRANGEPVTYPRAFGRAAAEIVSGMLCYIGYFIAAFDDQRRTLHDYMCDTRVVYR